MAKAQSQSVNKAPTPVEATAVSTDEDEDEDMEAASSASAGPKPEESPASLTQKNFRNHPDMENFFRFIYDNDLRLEALEIIDEMIIERQAKKKKIDH